ncbi:RecB family exonuclease [Nocardia cyriacigeorgica]|uniref:RecB family exonuclease n=1 Tax=Nocardia cyriacigeorgica TaxID=135487 RepID=A0A6P1D941_9NOCA|nr:RecB family exonuclease [Nocardia cyriacigeorgica]NEW37310.1 RecB family exonuclease [Nocardia cyriacigeorgica]NEW47215.1 RecB family exonuclease [Nocardia cyriacigeorgica]
MPAPATTPPADAEPAPGSDPARVRSRPALSPSRAMDFKQCPLKYRFRAIDRIPEPPGRDAVRGTVVHAVLEDLYGLPAAERMPERAESLAGGAWARVLAERPEVGELITESDLDVFLDEVRALVRTYYRLEDPTRFDPESCESRVEVELPDGVLLRGFVDRIDMAPTGELRVVDYKTGRAPGIAQETKALFQLKFYALVMLRTRGIVPAQLRLIYLADEQILTYAPDEEELTRFERTLAALWQAIRDAGRTGDFPPTKSWLCGYCDFKHLCPEFGGTPPPYPGWPDEVESPEQTFAESVAD